MNHHNNRESVGGWLSRVNYDVHKVINTLKKLIHPFHTVSALMSSICLYTTSLGLKPPGNLGKAYKRESLLCTTFKTREPIHNTTQINFWECHRHICCFSHVSPGIFWTQKAQQSNNNTLSFHSQPQSTAKDGKAATSRHKLLTTRAKSLVISCEKQDTALFFNEWKHKPRSSCCCCCCCYG